MGNSADIEAAYPYFNNCPKGGGKAKGKGGISSAKAPKGPPQEFKKGGGKGIRRQWTVEVEEKPGEGTAVQVCSGPHTGRRGVVVKVVGEGNKTRYRISFGDGAVATWVDSVQRVVMRANNDNNCSEPADDGLHWRTMNKQPSTNSDKPQANSDGEVQTVAPRSSLNGSEAGEISGHKSEPVAPARRQMLSQQLSFRSELAQQRRRIASQVSRQGSFSSHMRSSIRQQGSNHTLGTVGSQETFADAKFAESTNLRHGIPAPRSTKSRPRRLATGEIKEKGAKLREKNELEKQQNQQRKEHYKALQPADVNSVPWSQAKELNWVHGGSGGILLVDLGDQATVLKPQGKTAVSEQLAQLMAPICGVRVAQCKIVRKGEKEHEDILNIHTEKDVPVVGGDRVKASNIFGKWRNDKGVVTGDGAQFLGVLEYVPGHPLVGEEAHEALLSPDPEVLRNLGALCGMDVLLNNMDRVPLPVWSNEGNLGNVMVAAKGDSIIGIDQQVNPIKAGPGFDMYVDKVEKLYFSVAPGGDPEAVLCTLRQALHTNCAAELAEEHAPCVLEGLRECLEAIAQAWDDGSFVEALEKAAATCYDRFHDPPGTAHDLVHIWDEGELERMKDFLRRVAQKVSAAVQGLRATSE